MKNLLLTVVSIGSITSALAANTYVDWTSYNDTYSGTYTDVNRWNPQTYGYPGSIVPGTEGWTKDLIARFNNIAADYTVSFPAGTTTTYADLNVLVPLNHAVTKDNGEFVATVANKSGFRLILR